MKYAIIGSGAVGGLYGGLLANAGNEVHFLLNSDFHHVREHGLRIDSPTGDFVLESPHIYQRADDMPTCDVVILAMKSTNNHLLPGLLTPVVKPGGVVLNLQNGLDVESGCVDALGDRDVHVMGGCCFLCSNKIGPGHIHHLDFGRILFGQYRSKDPTACAAWGQTIVADMTGAKIDARWADDLAAARWRKLMWNIPFNGLSVVLNASTDAIMDSPPAKALADRLMREVHRGAARCGVTIEEAAIRQTMEHTETMVPYDSSMRLDFLAGRPMEVEAIFANPLAAVARAEAESESESESGTPNHEKPSQTMPSVAMLCQELQFLDSRPGRASKPDR